MSVALFRVASSRGVRRALDLRGFQHSMWKDVAAVVARLPKLSHFILLTSKQSPLPPSLLPILALKASRLSCFTAEFIAGSQCPHLTRLSLTAGIRVGDADIEKLVQAGCVCLRNQLWQQPFRMQAPLAEAAVSARVRVQRSQLAGTAACLSQADQACAVWMPGSSIV